MIYPSIPTATYRWQFNKNFTFVQARMLVPYLHELGISHVYASPYFQASPESPHGYDICNHNELNAAIGSRADYDAFVEELHRHGMQQMVDFVPNHMGIAEPLNVWWMDVLENGPSSRHAPFFDIDWRPLKDELENKVLLPILGDQYGRVLERGELKLSYERGAFFLKYYEAKLPLAPRSYALILGRTLENLAPLHAGEDFLEELQSIVTATQHLPLQTESEPAKVAERAREKEIIKRRLDRRCQEFPQIETAIEKTLREIEGRVGDPRSFDALDEILEAQAYRLSFWRVAAEEINYRRFFDINTLAALRMEVPEVFEAAHRLVFELLEKGALTGLRIDHVDGLLNPREYLEKLQAGFAARVSAAAEKQPLYLLVEKILVGAERLRGDWPVHGTTGYDFTNQVLALLIDAAAEKPFTELYHKLLDEQVRFADLVYQKKQLVMRLSLASEINVLGHRLNRLSEQNRWFRDFTLGALTTAVREVIACFPVYRTYLEPGRATDSDDQQVIARAVAAAKRRNPGMDASVFDFLREMLLMNFPENIDEAAHEEHVEFVMKFQQCTGPIMAKGLEDTVFYIYNRLAALNEVGGEPQRFGASPAALHAENAARQKYFPHTLLATSTHDTKRSEDTRARMAAISEIPADWRPAVARWRSLNRKYKKEIDGEIAPDANEEYLLYQSLLGTWPAGGKLEDDYLMRIQDYMTKAIKEAKVNSSWIQPHEAWDSAVRQFVQAVLRDKHFLESFEPIAQQMAQLGAINALSQMLIRLTAPGVPDTYQGTEMWDFSLVDPDNRRPVDYDLRRRELAAIKEIDSPAELLENWLDGRIKLFVMHHVLQFRRAHAALFAHGDYTPVEVTGDFAESVFAFARRHENQTLLVIAPRLTARVGFPPIGERWRETMLKWEGAGWRDLFTGREFAARLAEALRDFPLAVFVH